MNAPDIAAARAAGAAACPLGMVLVSGGTFRVGSDAHFKEEAPAHRVKVDGFFIDRTPVTNRQFKEFVKATGYVTVAERIPDAKDYPGALPHMLFAGSLVFRRLKVSTSACRRSSSRERSSRAARTFAPNYCRRYRPAARHAQPVDTSMSHIGFRCIVRPTFSLSVEEEK